MGEEDFTYFLDVLDGSLEDFGELLFAFEDLGNVKLGSYEGYFGSMMVDIGNFIGHLNN